MVGLVRGVHGLRGAVRVEVLTDRPEERFAPAPSCIARATTRPLTIAVGRGRSPTARAGGSASARSDRATPPTRCAAPISRRSSGPTRTSRAATYYWHEVVGAHGPRHRRTRARARSSDIYRVGETEVYVVAAARSAVRPAGRPRLHPDLRAAPRRDRRRRRRARPARAEARRAPDPDRPKAPRRPAAQGRAAASTRPAPPDAAAAVEPAAEPDAPAADRRRRDPRDRRPDPLPGDDRGAARARASPAGSRSRAWPTIRVHDLRTWGIGRHRASTTARTAAERG